MRQYSSSGGKPEKVNHSSSAKKKKRKRTNLSKFTAQQRILHVSSSVVGRDIFHLRCVGCGRLLWPSKSNGCPGFCRAGFSQKARQMGEAPATSME
eukprot:2687730-Amphidinium_carterae.1